MKNIIISGADGTGKSTIVNALEKYYKSKGLSTRTKWMRFNHFLARGVNFIGRLLGKSYFQEHDWGKVGYHNYNGLIGYLYIYCVFLDYYLFDFFYRLKGACSRKVDVVIIDRYILDIMADLIVDTRRTRLVIKLFKKIVKKNVSFNQCLILVCDPSKAKQRRPDLKDDLKYHDKINAFNYLAKVLKIQVLNTGDSTIERVVKEIVSKK